MSVWSGVYVYGHECLYFADCKFAFGIFGESNNAEVEPTFGVDSMVGFDAIVDAAETVLSQWVGTLN